MSVCDVERERSVAVQILVDGLEIGRVRCENELGGQSFGSRIADAVMLKAGLDEPMFDGSVTVRLVDSP